MDIKDMDIKDIDEKFWKSVRREQEIYHGTQDCHFMSLKLINSKEVIQELQKTLVSPSTTRRGG